MRNPFRKPVTRQQLKNRKTWRNALLSGDYTQTEGVLVRFHENSLRRFHCCLGVACEAVLGRIPEDGRGVGDSGFNFEHEGMRTGTLPGDLFEETFGLKPGEDALPTGDGQTPFTRANDTAQYNFQQIAAMIPLSRRVTTVPMPEVNG